MLDELLVRLGPCDLVLVEGFKRGDHPKLEVYRADCGQPPLGADDATVEAIALDAASVVDTALVQLPLDDTEAVLDFILRRVVQDAAARG
jgi:molybdopterin-guanine dinucleotide biosynthesis protein MobB